VATEVLERDAGARRVCLVRLGNRPWAVDVADAREIVVLGALTPVPLAPPHLVGLANLRGRVLPVVDIRGLLRLPPGRTGPGTQVLVVEANGLQAGIGVDGLLGLDTLSGLDPAGSDRADAYMWGRLRRGDGFVTLLDVPRIIQALRVWTRGE
jgi:purine-binding chemotaxis protein CheW